jgi:hypothetical protein
MAKRKKQKDKQRSTKHTQKTKDRVTRTPLKTMDELMCSGRVGSSCSTSGTRRVNLVIHALMLTTFVIFQSSSSCLCKHQSCYGLLTVIHVN